MILSAKQPDKPAGVLIDTGTGKRIPFARWFDAETGEYEHLVPAPNGVDVLVDPVTRIPYIRRGKAVGRLELVPFSRASTLGIDPPKKVESLIQPLSKDERLDGLEQYKKVFIQVWRKRGEADRIARNRFDEFLSTNSFLDCFVLKRQSLPTT